MSQSLESVVEQHLAAETPTPEPASPAVEAAPEPAAAATPEADPAPPTPTPSSLSDDTVLDLTIDGQPVQMTLAEARRNISLHVASTKRFQDAAEARKAADALRQQAEQSIAEATSFKEQVKQMLQDPQKLSALVMAAQARATGQPATSQTAPAFDPKALEEMVAKRSEEIFSQKLAEMQREAEATRVYTELDTYVSSLVKDHPVLSKVPGFAEHVYAKAMSVAQPGVTIHQVKDIMAAEIAATRTALDSATTAQQKAATTAKAAAVAATERGGSPVLPGAKTYKGLNDPERLADIEAFVQSSLTS